MSLITRSRSPFAAEAAFPRDHHIGFRHHFCRHGQGAVAI